MQSVILHTRDDLDTLLLVARRCVEEGVHEALIKRHFDGRTLKQNAALHKYCEILARMMNEAGYSKKKLLDLFRDGVELPVSMYDIKDVYRLVGADLYRKKSTADLDTKEIQDVYQVVDARFGELTGCRAEWPSRHGNLI